MRILNELEYAENMLQSGFKSKRYEYELKMLAKYYFSKGISTEDIQCLLLKFCNKYITDFNEIKYMNMLKRTLKYAQINSIFIVSPVDVTLSEIEKIRELEDLKLEKIMFILLVISKINRQSYELYIEDKIKHKKKNAAMPKIIDEYYADGKINSFFSKAKIYLKRKERAGIIKKLIDKGLIGMTKSCKYEINFIDRENCNNIALTINNFSNFVLEYMRYIGDNIGTCEECSGLFEIKGKNHKYCKNCWHKINRDQTRNRVKKHRCNGFKISLNPL